MGAKKIWKNGNIIQVNHGETIAEAVAIDGDQIIAVGRFEEMQQLIDGQTEVIDLEGKTMLPGFYDAHSHITGVGHSLMNSADLNPPPIGKCTSIGECIAKLKEYAEENKEGAITGRGFDDTLVAEKRSLTKEDLDQVSTERIVKVSHISGHIGYVNSKGLEYLNFTKDTPNPEGGVIQRDDVTGEPNGVLEEEAFLSSGIMQAGGGLDPAMMLDAMGLASENYASAGVTTANDGWTSHAEVVQLIQGAVAYGKYKIRMVINPHYGIMDAVDDEKMNSSHVTRGGIKLFHDGSLQGYTGYLSKPYHTPFQGNPEHRGYPTRSRESLTEMVKDIHRNGYQVVIHCNGDAAIDDFLYAYKEAQKETPREDARPEIIHCQTAREDQLDEFALLGITPSFFPPHVYYWGDRHKAIFLGPDRAAFQNPLKAALDRGITFSIHCDSPVVPQSPLLAIWTAVNRMSYGGEVIGADQCIPVMEAIKAYTINSAYQSYEENTKGSIEVGKLADFVVLGENILTCDPMKIKDIPVLETIVGGETVYKVNE